ncbi:putative invertase inhibitor [Nymphaea colorata]|uniref:putative invertase inhibitor n=1 Tax=Nymphaea colorata TaxID=210225 RepID=UPI00129E7671|nr:putative invertase inhibitor [Nymphaea colorata]
MRNQRQRIPIPHTIFFFLLFPLTSLQYVKSQGLDLIKRTCRQTDDFDFCLTTLQAVNGSYSADLAGLENITVTLGIRNATSTLYLINVLFQRTRWGTPLSDYLEKCEEMYSYALISLRFAVDQLRKRAYAQVRSAIAESIVNVVGCDDQKIYSPPLAKQNQDLMKLGELALSILKLTGYQG